ncbi:glycoside hydrolase family 97 protein [Zobellia galactanivorans]|uniref:glycoside hydrolase family 97 protein n=1 Tax=Zobellia galactanivorans (strain DSM 12802 / CCUG 47099 / CIP 106680 / NCIMB 13871 / Dsij) TaxID=63186 RepID=UPI001C067EBD|nr:glycoside hydrolase family 97 protein [Zobellia galactanivorans]MBU3025565.1 glycoside hydrolase family 97 protein [Zobellia galactanivorans]
MNTRFLLMGTFLFALLVIGGCGAVKKTDIPKSFSPDGNIEVFLKLDEGSGALRFSARLFDNTVLEASPLGIIMADNEHRFSDQLEFVQHERKRIDERYVMVTGKQKERHNYCTESRYTFKNTKNETFTVVFRVFNEGISFRYELDNKKETSVTKEMSAFNFKGLKALWSIDYQSGDENIFEKKTGTQTVQNKALSFPVLVESNSGNWMLASESDVSNFPLAGAMFNNDQLNLIYPGGKKGENVVGANFKSPWRILMMGKELSAIAQNSMVDHLARPSAIPDISWVEAGVTSFPWWGDNLANSSPETLKKYIDLSATMGWGYIEFDVPLINSPAHAIDDWKTTPWVKDVVDYGLEKGVKCYGWDEFKNLDTPEKRKDIFGRYNQLGIVGCKVDFINDYSQRARRILEEIIKDAARYKLMLSFHGAQAPRGFARTYPHIMSYEAVKGSEYYLSINGAKGLTPYHNATLPFTRNVLGSMDYTPVAFSTPLRTTTMAHELALSVVFESGWQGMCDIPEAYLDSPGRKFLENLPAAWDETKLLAGYPGEYCVMARRKGDDWYVGGISAVGKREFSIDLSEIVSGPKEVIVYQDVLDEDKLKLEKRQLTEKGNLKVALKKNGGFTLVLEGSGQ